MIFICKNQLLVQATCLRSSEIGTESSQNNNNNRNLINTPFQNKHYRELLAKLYEPKLIHNERAELQGKRFQPQIRLGRRYHE